MEKIRQLEQEQAGCRGLKEDLQGLNGSLEGIISQVNGLKAEKIEADIQRFSGVSAETADTGIYNAQEINAQGAWEKETADFPALRRRQAHRWRRWIRILRNREEGLTL